MPSSASKLIEVRQATPDERQDALKLALAHLSPEELARHCQAWTAAMARNEAVVWVGRRGESMVAALIVEAPAGGAVTVSLPHCADGEPPGSLTTTLAGVSDALGRSGVRLIQMAPAEVTAEQELGIRAAGYSRACELLYLVALRGTFPDAPPADDTTLIALDVAGESRLAEVVERTYADSLDCPSLREQRAIADVLAGYRQVGQFDPALWFVAQRDGVDVGCSLLADHSQSNAWELVYMGVVPEARGRGLGLSLVRHAQWLAGAAGRERMTAVVDADNEPAVRVYAAAGFVGWDRRAVFLRTF
jgi:ribosomal protein S18 acetylase RimI-like enzyme